MLIQVLGTGCPKCLKLEELAKKAVAELGIEAKVEKVKELDKIMSFGVMVTPALVVDGTVKVAGRVPDLETIKGYLK